MAGKHERQIRGAEVAAHVLESSQLGIFAHEINQARCVLLKQKVRGIGLLACLCPGSECVCPQLCEALCVTLALVHVSCSAAMTAPVCDRSHRVL